MKINDFKLIEVAMNPSSFAQSLEAGASKGVRVGYEFEVCVPEKTIKNYKEPETGPEVYKKKCEELVIRYYNFFDDMLNSLDPRNETLLRFQKYFTPKNGAVNFTDAVKKIQAKIKVDTKPIADKVPAATLRSFMKLRGYEKITYEHTQMRRLSWYLEERPGKKLKALGEELLEAIEKTIKRGLDGSDAVTKLMFNKSETQIRSNFSSYFDYDPKIAYEKFIKPYAEDAGYGDDDDDYEYGDYNYGGAKRVLKPAIEKAFGATVHTFNEYHESRKNLTDWYIEPDGSLHPNNDSDGIAEIVTPPLGAIQAVQALKTFYKLSKEMGLYTNNSTGLHINVSIPEKLDILKLAIFLGDEYVLKSFDREDSEYAESAMRHLKGNITADEFISKVKKTGATKVDPKKLLSYAKSATEDHMASISDNGKYISFRHAGGDYLANYEKIANTVGRFIRAMVIASDPNAYREEYLKKLVKIFGEKPSQIFDEDHSFSDKYKRVIDTIKSKGVPAVVLYLYINGGSRENALRKAIYSANHNHRAPVDEYKTFAIEKNSVEAQQIIASKFQNPDKKEKARKAPKSKFLKVTLLPPIEDSNIMTREAYTIFFRAVENNGVNGIDWDYNNYMHVGTKSIPLSHPEMKPLYIAAAKEYMRMRKKEIAASQAKVKKVPPKAKKKR